MAIIKDFIVRSGIILQGTSAVTSATGQLGALQVNSGAAIAKNLIVGQSAQIYGEVSLYDKLNVTGSAKIDGVFTASSGATLQGNVTIGGTLGVTGNSTLSSLTVTNASVFNGTISVNNTATFNAPLVVSGSNTLSVGTGQATFGGIVSLTSNEAATTGGDGALRVAGGAFVGGNLVVNSTNANTQTSTANALYVAGGAWIDKTFVVSGDTTFRGNVTFNGTQTNVYSTNTVYTDNILNLHVPSGSTGTEHTWTVDDGKDIGFVFNYYDGVDKDGFLGLSNASGYLEWYDNGAESNGVYTASSYGIFKTGGIRLAHTDTAISSSTGALQVAGGISAGNIYAENNISGLSLTARNLTQGRVVFVGAGGTLTDSGNLTFDGTTLSATVTTATNANNLLGGAVGSIPFQTATNQTVFLPIGNAGEILYVSGGKPAWTSASGLSAGNANTSTNLAGGTAGQVPYQTTAGNTSFFGPGVSGQLLQSNGTSGPLYVNTGNVHVGYAVYGSNIIGGSQGQIPIQTGANATAFIPAGTSDTFLRHDGTTATFVTTSTIFVGNAVTATNIRAGTAGQVLYQSAAGVTGFTGPGNAGEILVSNGTSGPIFQNTLTLAGTTNSTSTNTGALQVVGGVGIGKDAVLGGNITVNGGVITTPNLTINGSSGGIGGVVISAKTSSSTEPYFTGYGYHFTFLPGQNPEVSVGTNLNGVRVRNDYSFSWSSNTNSRNTPDLVLLRDGAGALGIRDGSNPQSLRLYNVYSTATNYERLGVNWSANTAQIFTEKGSTGGLARDLVLGTDGTEHLRITSTGNIGIGTSATTAKLTVSGGVSISGITTVTNTTQATSTTSGALQVVGGAGIGGNLYVGGTSNLSGVTSITNNTGATNVNSGALQVTGGAGIGQNLYVGGTANVAGQTQITNNTAATSTTSGALVVSGGAGIGQNLFVGGNLNVTGTISGTLTGNATTVSTQQTNTNASHFLAFVDSNNASAGAENIYTTSSFTVNPSNGNVNISGSVTVGSAVSGSTVNALYSNNVLLSSYTTPALTSSTSVTLDVLSTSSYRTARYTVQVVQGVNVHVTEAVLFHDGANAYLNEYGISTTAGELGVFDATIQTGNMLFTFTPGSTASTVVKVVRMALTS